MREHPRSFTFQKRVIPLDFPSQLKVERWKMFLLLKLKVPTISKFLNLKPSYDIKNILGVTRFSENANKR